MNTIELIEAIERRPGMYIDGDSLESLHSFVRGYYFARSQSGALDEQDIFFADNFYAWLKAKHSMEDAPSWAALIQTLSKGREPLAVFFREFREFRVARPSES